MRQPQSSDSLFASYVWHKSFTTFAKRNDRVMLIHLTDGGVTLELSLRFLPHHKNNIILFHVVSGFFLRD